MKSKITILISTLLASALISKATPPAPPSGKKWGKVQALSDEFDTNKIDNNKWFDYHPFWSGRPPSQFKKGNAFTDGKHLVLRSTSRIDNMNQVAKPFEDHWVDAAAVVSKTKIAEPGWYYECSMKASNTAMSSSFWFRVGQFSEIDVIEHIGHATKNATVENRVAYKYGCNTHVYGTKSGPSIGEEWTMPRRGRDGFEIYGLWWKNPTTLIFYYNNEEVMRVTPAVPFTEKLHMIFDTETLSSTFVGLPTIASLKDNNRNAMRVDWVRAYKLVNAPNSNGTPSPGQKIALKGNNKKYVSSEDGNGPMNSNRNAIGAWEVFTVVDAGGGKIALKGNNGKYVSSENGASPIYCNRNKVGNWEKFTVVNNGDNTISFRGNNGRYISSENGTRTMTCNRKYIWAWQKFTWSVR